ncbi:GPR endopeptidase [Clostridiisalibacter paucivorans]|uniref:GPR endopeptidase n=1 Tax=Clostridiisalibacter paucivorans TaxID=408753 RepID=UPI0004793840|nr:GPR endopeptidase [Clostridiisalibacter paucivorans]
MYNIRTDLAIETRELYREQTNEEVPGVKVERKEEEDYVITRVKVLDESGKKNLGKEIGDYITIEAPALKKMDQDFKDEMSMVLAKEIKALIPSQKVNNTLVVGLGNWNVTPDALGPKAIKHVLVTRHFFKVYNKKEDETMANVSAISPGVMGITGIETGEIIKGIVEKTNPDLVVAVDALASRRMERVATTIQISDTGINPGSGVGNRRIGLNKKYLGVPVIAIGIPTVVDAATIVNDTMDMLVDNMLDECQPNGDFYSLLNNMKKEDKYGLITEVLNPFEGNVMVTPKEIDDLINNVSTVIANSINISLHPGIDLKDVNRFLN